MKWLLIALMTTSTLSAAIEDKAALFSAAAVTAANKKLADIKTSTAKEILILTTNDLGGKSISEYSRQEAAVRKLNGVIIVISTKPRMLEVIPGRKTAMVFTHEQARRVREILAKNLRKTPDAALKETVDVFYEVFSKANSALLVADEHRRTAPVTGHAATSSGWLKWIIIIVVVLLIVRLIGFFMSRNANSGAAGTTPGTPSAFGGGGFFPSLMGGIFGAMAGHWLYDRFFSDHNDHSNHTNDSGSDNSGWRGDDNGDMGSGSGGDWGGDGGGDAGGGDSGGGGDW